MRSAGSITAAFLVAATLAACGERTETIPEPPSGAFAAALATVNGPATTTGIGIGWLDQAALRDIGGDHGSIADALAPNASAVFDVSPQLAKRFGFDPRRADRLVSIGGSYAFGLRTDGVAAPRLERALIRDGAEHRSGGGATLVDAAPYASVPGPLLAEGVRGLGARDAFADDTTILAISDTARGSLLERGASLVNNPTYAASADCLGDVVAARLIPAKLARSHELGTDIIALGVERPSAGAGLNREVICAVGSSAESADAIAEALRAAFGADATDPVNGEPMDDAAVAATVDRLDARGLSLVRARLELAPGQRPGYVYDAYLRGSVTAFFGFGAPHADEVGSG